MTLEHILDIEEPAKMYGGTKRSYKQMEDPEMGPFWVAVRIIDLPFTVVADTVTLPIMAPIELLSD